MAGRTKTGPQTGVDPRWDQVDDYIFESVHANSSKEVPTVDILEKAYAHQTASGLPDIAVSPSQGKFIQVQAKLVNAKNILEVGTLGGYSTIFLANTSPETRVTTVEYSPHHAKTARENFEMAGIADRVTVLEGAGVDVLPKILEDVEDGKRPLFDFVFIDADKKSNWIYFDLAVQMSRTGALIIVDNVIRWAKIVDPAWLSEENVVGSRTVIENAGKDPRVSASVLQTVGGKNYDGMVFAVVLDK